MIAPLVFAALLVRRAQGIPTEIAGGRSFIAVEVSGHSETFLLDTGAAGCSIDLGLAKKLGLSIGPIRTIQGVGTGVTRFATLTGATATVRGVQEPFPLTAAIDLAPLAKFEGRPILGVIGMPFFERGEVEIDFDRGRVSMGSLPPASGEMLPFTMEGGHILLPVRIVTAGGEKLALNAVVDTGAKGTLLACAPFQAKHRLEQGTRSYAVTHVASGLGGASPGFVTRLSSIEIGAHSFAGPPIRVSTSATGLLAGGASWDALIGFELLRRFTLRIDVPHHRIGLMPNSHIAEPFPVDQCGMVVLAHGESLLVEEVLAGSPAASGGVQVGDQVLSVNGHSSASLGLYGLNRVFTEPGGPLTLLVSRHGKAVMIVLSRRPLI